MVDLAEHAIMGSRMARFSRSCRSKCTGTIEGDDWDNWQFVYIGEEARPNQCLTHLEGPKRHYYGSETL